MKKLIWIIVIALVCISCARVYYSKVKTGGTAVETVSVSKGQIKEYLEETADVKSKEKKTIFIEGEGKITRINFDVGDWVKKGDIMLSQDKADLELQLRDANAKIDAAREQIKGAENTNAEDKIKAAKAVVEQARVAYNAAQREYEKAKKLYEADVISNAEFSKSEDGYRTSKAALDAASAQLADLQRGIPQYLKNTYKSQLEQALVFRDNILRSIDKQQVKAPIDGVILEKNVEDNSYASAGTSAYIIGNVKKLELEANILADDCKDVHLEDQVEISGKPLGNSVLRGKVSEIAPAAKSITSTLGVIQKRVPVTIELQNGNGTLKPGYTVDIKIITAHKKDVLTVPDSSVFDYNGETCVLAVQNGETIITGLENDQVIEVVKGLNGGEKILVKPDNTIKEGMKVREVERK